jgi:hypothetical protein
MNYLVKYHVKRLVKERNWELLGKIFDFKPVYHGSGCSIDWRCVPMSVTNLLWGAVDSLPVSPEIFDEVEIEVGKYRRDDPHKHRPISYSKKIELVSNESFPCAERISVRVTLYEQQGKKCFYCGQEIGWNSWTVDHLIPRARGGNDHFQNKVGACGDCNSKKSMLTAAEFASLDPVQRVETIRMFNEILPWVRFSIPDFDGLAVWQMTEILGKFILVTQPEQIDPIIEKINEHRNRNRDQSLVEHAGNA